MERLLSVGEKWVTIFIYVGSVCTLINSPFSNIILVDVKNTNGVMCVKAIPKRQANDAAFEELLENIKSGVWKKGEKLPSENELCNILQVSRSTVRIALQRLKALGLIEVKHGKGSYVLDTRGIFEVGMSSQQLNLTQKEFYDFTVLRESIEPKALELALKREDREALQEIRIAYENMVQASEIGDLEEYSRQDCKFHLSILLASGNELFIQIVTIFKEQYCHYFQELNKFLLREQDGKKIIAFNPKDENDPHTQIYKALCGESTAEATAAVEKILKANRLRYESYCHVFSDKEHEPGKGD